MIGSKKKRENHTAQQQRSISLLYFFCLGLLVGVRDSGYEEEKGGARSHDSLVVEEKEEAPKQPGQRSGR